MAETIKQGVVRRFGATIEYYRPDEEKPKLPLVISDNPIIQYEQRKKAKAVVK